MRKIFITILLISVALVSVNAQTNATTTIQVGDSVMVDPNTTHYETGEKISPWVYKVKHAVEQIGSFFHPDGVLLKGIKSWIYQSAVVIEVNATDNLPTEVVETVVQTSTNKKDTTKVPEQKIVQTSIPKDTTEITTDDAIELVEVKQTFKETPADTLAEKIEEKKIVAINTPTRLVGRIVSADQQAIEGAVITLVNQGITTTTNAKGEFSLTYLEATNEEVILEANGFISDIVLVQLEDGILNNLGDVMMQTDIVREAQEEILLNLSEMDLNDDEGKSQSVSSASSASQDVFNSTVSFAWSNARYRGRGYDQTYETNYIEGLNFTAAERGQFNFSAMGGLNDATRYKEVVEGIEANNFSFGSIGQATNYLQSATNYAQGWKVGLAATNRNYKGAARATYSSGLMENGWAFAAQ